MDHRYARYGQLALALVLAAATAPFFGLSFFAHPQNDEYVLAQKTLLLGYGRANAAWYLTWIGRYFSTALLSANPLVFGSFAAYKLVAFLLLTLLLASAFAAVSALSPPGVSRVGRANVALALTALFLWGMPNVAEGLYWMAGLVTYQLGGVLLLFTLVATVRTRAAREPRRRRSWLAVAAALVVATAGTNEVTALHLSALLSLMFVCDATRANRIDRGLAALATLAVVMRGVALLSPGSRARLEASARPELASAVAASFTSGATWLWRWLGPSPVLGVLALPVPGFAAAARRGQPPRVHLGWTGAIVSAAYFASFFPSHGGRGTRDTDHQCDLVGVPGGARVVRERRDGARRVRWPGALSRPCSPALFFAFGAAVVLLSPGGNLRGA